MEGFFTWVAAMEHAEVIRYALLLALVMLMIPYFDSIPKIIRKVVYWKKLTISEFGYKFYPYQEKVDAEDGFVMEGGKVLLHWNVEGALSVRINQGFGIVNGNAAETIINRNRRHFILEARGVFSKKKAAITIPLEKIKVLDTVEISENEVQTDIGKVTSASITQSRLNKIYFTLSYVHQKAFTRQSVQITSSLNYALPEILYQAKDNRDYCIGRQTCLKTYTYSTQKYNILHQSKHHKTKLP